MKIMFVDLLDPRDPLNWSGTLASCIKSLEDRHEVVAVGNLNSSAKALYLPYVFWCKLPGKRFQLLRHELVARQLAMQVLRAYRQHRPDVVFSMTSIPLAYLPSEVPFVFWCDAIMDCMIDFYWSASEFHRLSLNAGRAQERRALAGCRAAIFSSRWAADAAARALPAAREKIFVVPFGANNPSASALPEPKQLPPPGEPIRILFVGVDFERKGGRATVEAVKILHDRNGNVHLDIVGCKPFPDGEVPPFVTQHGFLSKTVAEQRSAADALFGKAHLFVMPSHAECTAIVFAEAASYGLPSVSRNVGGTATMVHDGKTGVLIGPNDGPEALAEAILRVVSDRETYRQMSLAALDLYRTQLNWTTAGEALSKILAARV